MASQEQKKEQLLKNLASELQQQDAAQKIELVRNLLSELKDTGVDQEQIMMHLISNSQNFLPSLLAAGFQTRRGEFLGIALYVLGQVIWRVVLRDRVRIMRNVLDIARHVDITDTDDKAQQAARLNSGFCELLTVSVTSTDPVLRGELTKLKLLLITNVVSKLVEMQELMNEEEKKLSADYFNEENFPVLRYLFKSWARSLGSAPRQHVDTVLSIIAPKNSVPVVEYVRARLRNTRQDSMYNRIVEEKKKTEEKHWGNASEWELYAKFLTELTKNNNWLSSEIQIHLPTNISAIAKNYLSIEDGVEAKFVVPHTKKKKQREKQTAPKRKKWKGASLKLNRTFTPAPSTGEESNLEK